jgi:uncharacterized damage-inducible protein DinB
VSDFSERLSEVTANLERRRGELLAALSECTGSDLVRARRGGWTVGRVLEHIISSEWHYVQLARNLRGVEALAPGSHTVSSVADAGEALARSRAALWEAVGGVTEEDFYRLGPVGREEYSVVSMLENVEQHDIEHLGQIRSILAGSA